MKIMKRMVKAAIVFGLAFALLMPVIIRQEAAYAKKASKEYSVFAPDVTKFKVSGKKLIIKAVKEWNHGIYLNDKSTDIKKLSLKLSKKCKWSTSTPRQKDYKPLSYKEMRKCILQERKAYVEYGQYDGGSGVYVTIRKNKVVRVNYCAP